MRNLSYKPDNKVYCGISGMSPGEFVDIVTGYFKSFDRNYVPSKGTLSEIFDLVKKREQGFSRSIIIKATQEYSKDVLNRTDARKK